MLDKVYKTKEDLFLRAQESLNVPLLEYPNFDGLNKKDKGSVGAAVESCWFGLSRNSRQESDFLNLGVELKVTPYKRNPSKSLDDFCAYSAKERLRCTEINYFKEIENSRFEDSHCYQKMKETLLMFYEYLKEQPVENRFISEVALLSLIEQQIDFKQLINIIELSEFDLQVIRQDWETICKKIREGRAHELSEGDTTILGAATHGKDKTDLTSQPFSSIPAMRRTFAIKQGYMSYLLRKYVLNKSITLEKVLREEDDLTKNSFEEIILARLKPFYNKTESELRVITGYEKNAKNKFAIYVSRLLKINCDDITQTEEFQKSNIAVKTIRISCKVNKKGIVKHHIEQSMSFSQFKPLQLIQERNWEESELYEEMTQRFLLVIFEEDEHGELFLKKSMFWSIPESDLEKVEETWCETIRVLKRGVHFIEKHGKRYNDLPGMKFNGVSHVRPKASNAKDVDSLPGGGFITKQCFWLNNSYIEKIIGLKS